MKKAYPEMSAAERQAEYAELRILYNAYKSRGLALNMARGKPSPEQLDLSNGLIESLKTDDHKSCDGRDLRNYSGLTSIPEINTLFASMLSVTPDDVLVHGNGSLALMYDVFLSACLFALPGADAGWFETCGGAGRVKVLCPCPGYDRHFSIAEKLGCELIPVRMTPDGPDMDEMEELCRDPLVKACWIVPIYSNPTGAVCTEEVYKRLAAMDAAPDFRVFMDNAYGVHNLTEHRPRFPNLLAAAEQAGNADRFFLFASTSKITFASAGIAALGASAADRAWFLDQLKIKSIGDNKIQQLRHARFIETAGGLDALMAAHRSVLAPKFTSVLVGLKEQLDGLKIAVWSKPEGGYFVSVDLLPGCARRAWTLCRELGVTLTGPGATFPYGKDPDDANIRLAPSYPPVDELTTAIEVFCLAARMAALEKLGV